MTELDCHTPSLNITEKNKVQETVEPDNGFQSPMRCEQTRFKSFVDWPISFISPYELAKAGFFYTKKEDIVKCAFCGIELCRWKQGDNVMCDHLKWSSRCPFALGIIRGNASMSENPSNGNPDGHDTCGKYGVLMPNSYPEDEEPSVSICISKHAIQTKPAVHPNFATLEKRLQSFQEWPVSLKQKPKDLAEAGFFYTEKGDQTICFSCGGGLKNWEEDDIPWEQHARWFPKCSFLLLQKSKEYVTEVCSRHEAVLTAEQAEALSVPNAPSTSTVNLENNTKRSTNTKQAVEDETTKENSEASKSTLCKICFTNEVGVVFLPCGHMIACTQCAPALPKCPVCRGELEATVRAFLS